MKRAHERAWRGGRKGSHRPRLGWSVRLMGCALCAWACHVGVGTYVGEEEDVSSFGSPGGTESTPAKVPEGAARGDGRGTGADEREGSESLRGEGPSGASASPAAGDGADAIPGGERDGGVAGARANGGDDRAQAPTSAIGPLAPPAPPGAGDPSGPLPAAALDVLHPLPPRCQDSSDCDAGAQCRETLCAPSTCGDGERDPEEECDDGNVRSADGCEPDCTATWVVDMESTGPTTCALLSGGSVKCWGRDQNGQLGRGSTGEVWDDPALVEPLDFGTSRRVVQLSSGGSHYCVLFEDGLMRCWGGNALGQLGTGTQDDYGDSPGETLAALRDVPMSSVRQISADQQHTCLLRAIDSLPPQVMCWGDADSGKLGIGNVTGPVLGPSTSNVVNVGNALVTRVRAARSATCVALATRELLCWGNNSVNGLGGAGNTWAPDPVRHVLRLGDGIDDLSGGFCAFGPPRDLFCWGNNDGANRGTPLLAGELIRTPTRIQLGDRRFVSFESATDHACGLTEEGRVSCLGRSTDPNPGYASAYDPALHAGDNWDRLPNDGAVDVGDYDGHPGIDPVQRLIVTRNLTCAEMHDRSLRCWGSNTSGRLGYGFSADTPIEGLSGIGHIGDDETPAEAYARIGRPSIRLW